MRLLMRRSLPVLVGVLVLAACGGRSEPSVESVREALGDDADVITELRINGAVVAIRTSLTPGPTDSLRGLAMCRTVHDTDAKTVFQVWGEFKGMPVLLARTAVGDKPGDCRQGDLVGDPALQG
ncbi:hypothetical protein ABZV60_24670 [Streptomyces sp. NPDC004787]|uniref:hypothetical protein n=1 Tax=Streptomyces sp. NPDC004787 TaxID=3154291 RepID=UPI0033A30B60